MKQTHALKTIELIDTMPDDPVPLDTAINKSADDTPSEPASQSNGADDAPLESASLASSASQSPLATPPANIGSGTGQGLMLWLKNLLTAKPDNDESLRHVIEEYIEEMSSSNDVKESAEIHELNMLSNVLDLKDMTAEDIMVPRADIVAIDLATPEEELLNLLVKTRHSRIPVYRETLDDIMGIIYIKDAFRALVSTGKIEIKSLMREPSVISPAMPIFDLLMLMRHKRQHMMFVVDEYGGIDGLVTLGDILGSIVGELHDDYYNTAIPEMEQHEDGSYLVDARMEIGDFEEEFGQILSAEERDVADTLGGFIFTLAGRVPARGEVLHHEETGLDFEIIDADPRRVTRIRVRPVAREIESKE
ncbi:MAG: HlyC/CorC family transporter [Alphaproteobacteria bacterium]|nr:HlyC/CorC family transporter [Alphaproteobacteria bacterium]